MIYTTYFANLRNLPDYIVPVSICGKAPDWYNGLQYKKLAPKIDFFMKWKKDHNNDAYIECYNNQVLDSLNFEEVMSEIYNIVNNNLLEKYGKTKVVSIALVCYEKPEDFCHRHLVAKWIRKNKMLCKEWYKQKEDL